MMGFDDCGISQTAFDDIGINRTLHQIIYLADFSCFIFKYTDKFRADDFTLLFGVGYALQLGKETLLCICSYEMRIEIAVKNLFYLVAFVFTHQTMVNENAGQLLADCLGNQSRNNGGIHAAGEGTQSLAVANLLADFFNLVFDVVCHCPIALTAADLKQEVFNQCRAFGCMVYLRVELHAIEALCFTFDGSRGAGRGFSDDAEAFGQLCHIIRVAHPANFICADAL